MIYIFSQPHDGSTNSVCRYLNYYGAEYIRIDENSKDEFSQLKDHLIQYDYEIGLRNQDGKERMTFWFRRPLHNLIDRIIDYSFTSEDVIAPKFNREGRYFRSFELNFKWHQKRYFASVLDQDHARIGSLDHYVNKLDVLKSAQQCGLDIPETIVTSKKTELVNFYNEHDGNIITKSLFEVILGDGADKEGFYLDCTTKKVQSLEDIPDTFFPTMFQSYVEKKYEIRVFFLKSKCYSAAIFSQNNEKTKLDFRNYDSAFMNRMVPYRLPKQQEECIAKLMKDVGLNSGSIDIIKGKDGMYYFLEINPVGQYGFVDVPCNYKLNEIIAQELIKMDGKEIEN